MSGSETEYLRRSYAAYLITDEKVRELERLSSMEEARAYCLRRARAERGDRYLIFGETAPPQARGSRQILLCRWVPPWYPSRQGSAAKRPDKRLPGKPLTMRRSVKADFSTGNPRDLWESDRKQSTGKGED